MSISKLLTVALGIICILVLLRAYRNKDKTIIWSPITFLTLTVLYYFVLPEFTTSREFEGRNVASIAYSFHLGALLSYLSMLFGFFFISKNKPVNWKKWNNLFSEDNAFKYSIILFIIAMACYVPYRGLHFTFLSNGSELAEYDYSSPGLSYYFVNMVAILCASCCLLLPQWRKHKVFFVFILWMTLVAFIVAGFRYRIIIMVISMFTVFYLHSTVPKRIRILPVVVIAMICYVGFNVMDHARDYGNGIRLDVIAELDDEDVTAQAGETERVYNYSIIVMDRYNLDGQREYFKPIINAAFMPIPRVIFPWKPNADYMAEAADYVMNNSGAPSAYVNFVEAFMAFGWLGIILNGIFIGWLSRKFWNNYRYNTKSIGAIVALALFNGLTYVIVSRGYLAQQFSCFLFYVCFPFWLSRIINTVIKK